MKSWDLDPSVFTSSASQGNINTVYVFLHRQIDTNPRHLGRSTEDVIAELSKLPGFLASNERWLASVVAQLALKGCGYQELGGWVAGWLGVRGRCDFWTHRAKFQNVFENR